MGLHSAINDSLGRGGKNNTNDIATIIKLLSDRKRSRFYRKLMLGILIPRLADKDVVLINPANRY